MSSQSQVRLSVLTDLQEYVDANEAGNVALKKSLWQITKLRRKQNRGIMSMEDTFSADQVREELRARTMVRDRNNKDDDEPSLISEAEKPSSLGSTRSAPDWESVDALEEKSANKENPGSASLVGGPALSSGTSGGLRQRKNKGKEIVVAASSNEAADTGMTEDVIVDEEEKLLQRDPLELFHGVRPGDLKLAQQHAKAALDSYIVAASQAARILHHLNQAKGTK